jgi:hypothetical protein
MGGEKGVDALDVTERSPGHGAFAVAPIEPGIMAARRIIARCNIGNIRRHIEFLHSHEFYSYYN